MSLTRTVLNGNTRYRFDFIGVTAKIDTTAERAAHYLFNAGHGDHGTLALPKTWEDQNTAAKLALVNGHIRQVILDLAKTYHVMNSKDTAGSTAEQEAASDHQVDDE